MIYKYSGLNVWWLADSLSKHPPPPIEEINGLG